MAAKITYTMIISIIILVVLLLVVIGSLITPVRVIYDEEGKLKITDMLIPSTGLGGVKDFSMGIADGDSQLVKIEKLFKNFDLDLVYSEDTDGTRIYNKIIIEGDVSNVADDISIFTLITTFVNAISEWNQEKSGWDQESILFEVDCLGLNLVSQYTLDENCWNSNFDNGQFMECTVYSNYDTLKGKKTIRVMWIYSIKGGKPSMSPVITICGE